MRKTISSTVIFVFATALLLATQAQSQKPAAGPKVRSEMLVSTDWLAKHLHDPKIVVLHVARDRKNYDDGHVPGARFLSWSDLVGTRNGVANELPPVEQLQKTFEQLAVGDEARIIIYGDNNGLSAARAYFTLDYLGSGDRTALLDGGFEQWKAEKRGYSTESVHPTPARFTVRPRPQILLELAKMRELSQKAAESPNAGAAILDARPDEQYTGKPGERSGHIPGATGLYWMNNINSKDDLRMKPADDLRKLYEALGLKPGQQVVTYCNTGVQASQTYFTLKYLGYDAKMYDGSFSEWVKAEGTGVATGKK